MIISLSNISASFGVILAKLLKMKILIFNYEPHSQFQLELGLWSKNSFKYKLLNIFETYAGLHGDYVLTGTKSMSDKLISSGARGKIFRAPSSVDETIFKFSPSGRTNIRNELGVHNKKVLLYLILTKSF